MKKPFLHALGAGIYIVIVIFVVDALTSGTSEETLIIPITMLGLFVLSTAVMGFLFLSEPIRLFMENKKQEALSFFLKVLGIFACFVALFAMLTFLV